MDGLNGEVLYVCYLWIYIATVFTFFHIFKNAKDLHFLSNKFDLSKHILLVYLSGAYEATKRIALKMVLSVYV